MAGWRPAPSRMPTCSSMKVRLARDEEDPHFGLLALLGGQLLELLESWRTSSTSTGMYLPSSYLGGVDEFLVAHHRHGDVAHEDEASAHRAETQLGLEALLGEEFVDGVGGRKPGGSLRRSRTRSLYTGRWFR